MGAQPQIATLFARDVHRRIEEVIKVDQTDEEIVSNEIDEYEFTDSIRHAYRAILKRYDETPNRPHEGIGVWVSGFFGSGKSSFAKNLGFAIANRSLLGLGAAELLGAKANNTEILVLLRQIVERIPTHAVIFDIATDRGIRTGSQTVTEIIYRLFLGSLGYAQDLDLAELEITLEGDGRLAAFEQHFAAVYNQPWSTRKGLVSTALSRASRIMHDLEPETYATPDSWVQAAKQRADITPGLLAERCKLLMARRKPGHALLFVVDEVGQFVARDVQKMLDLQAVVQALGRVGRGRMWLVVTSQERLSEVVGALDPTRVELPRLMDRFPQELQVHLEPSDISEVTGKRVLAKKSAAQSQLRTLFAAHRGALEAHTRLTADIRLPELSADAFIDLYPLLPYHVDLIIQVVSGLRTQGGASKHVGGANRTIIKLAQQLLVNPAVDMGAAPIGRLVTLDQIYDLVASNITSDIRGKIADIPKHVSHPLAQAVAKAICLLQFVQSVHRTAENIAATLYPAVGADSLLSEVRIALEQLEKAALVRKGEDGYRIPTPTEDDWEKQRRALSPSGTESNILYAELLTRLWKPQPSYTLLQTRQFRAGLFVQGKSLIDGDLPIYLYWLQPGEQPAQRLTDLRARSQTEPSTIFWLAQLSTAIDQLQVELYRSRQILKLQARTAESKEEGRLVREEGIRQEELEGELLRLLTQALLRGHLYFRGNDRSPDERATDLTETVIDLLRTVLPEVFNRFAEAAARVQAKDIDLLLTADNLNGLTPIYTKLQLLREEGGKPIFATERGPLAELLTQITHRHQYGEGVNGRLLAELLGKEPFGWEFDMVRLLTASLLRAGKIELTSRSQTIESVTHVEARNTFNNNNFFRQATIRPKVTIDQKSIITAARAYSTTFGREISELEQGVLVAALREAIGGCLTELQDMTALLKRERLPGNAVLDEALEQMQTIRRGVEEAAINAFIGSSRQIKEAVRRAGELRDALHETALQDVTQARRTLNHEWAFLQQEAQLSPELAQAASELADILQRETFFRDLPAIRRHTHTLSAAYHACETAVVAQRQLLYQSALDELHATPGWTDLAANLQQQIATPLAGLANAASANQAAIPQIRADIDACAGRLRQAVEKVYRAVDGARLVTVTPARYFQGGIETEEELDAALTGLRAEIAKLLGEGKKVLVQ
jgi:hypothetical protein